MYTCIIVDNHMTYPSNHVTDHVILTAYHSICVQYVCMSIQEIRYFYPARMHRGKVISRVVVDTKIAKSGDVHT